MKMTSSWIILYSCLLFGSEILCDRKLERRQAVSNCSVNTDDKYYCSNGLCIEWSRVCDGYNDCSDGSDETEELCAQYVYGINMNMDCGKVNISDKIKSKMIEGHDVKEIMDIAPWVVDIYKFFTLGSDYKFIIVGSIIASNMVISVAHTFWQKNMISKKISINDGLYKIGVGKFGYNLTITDNGINQIIDVDMIYMSERFNGKAGLYADNIAVIVLANKFSFLNGVAPVCIDWNSKYMVHDGDQGQMVVLAKNNYDNNLYTFFPYISHSSCKKMYDINRFTKYVTLDKFCTCHQMEHGEGIQGAGISFLHLNSYFLTGVMSRWDRINKDTVFAFTDIKYHVSWIRGLLIKHLVFMNSCVLPNIEGVVYNYEGSNKILSPGTLINDNTTVIGNCEVGFHKVYPNGLRFCQGNKKLLNYDKFCLKMCQPLLSDSLDIKCSHNGKYANCSDLSIPGTIAIPKCKHNYALPNRQQETTIELHCQSNGLWDKELYICEPDCGRPFIKAQILIKHGETANVGTAPWNVAIYQKTSDYEFICGGSIISQNLVISAAHCFWKKGMPYTITIVDDLYKIAAGKYYRNFTIYDSEFPQIINVDRIHLKEGYFGFYGHYADDMAVVVLQNSVFFRNGITPICIDWDGNYTVSNGDVGKVVGWGKTEKDILSPTLLQTDLPYIDIITCRHICNFGFDSYVTSDKFCAGSSLVSGYGVEGGDSGAGLCFAHSKLYYLTGVVSLKEAGANNSLALFTSVDYHLEWLRRIYNHYKKV
ncbi:uncharacterized protein LOC132944607 isoform X1 [Metopolophium dirhodum]|uniref:uncharacterized protein LOC132944607 isoform X1 n=2 Tax=Metopolophium dirhodum TaxID=44670 RepID=UPI0029901EA9|nr:uncharacterized protein LOC132944607 isoform X1 [Metopolophium dirhodum]XP_060870028.1 uncharacterized protein LOC132944607 isoform X1 [Metopolophium dirhodum]